MNDPRLNTVLGGYKLIQPLGRGSAGLVYLAKHQVMGNKAAVKIVPGAQAEAERERFVREAKTAFSLNHPNVVRVLHADITPEGEAWMAMDFVEGPDLREYVPKTGLEAEEAVRMLVKLCAGLAAAHQAGLVHRDIKPANILVDDKTNTPKITDFGLAQAEYFEKHAIDDERVGTPRYMPPEQWVDAGSVDARGDIYALGATAFYMLTGKGPFVGTTMAEVQAQVQKRERLSLEDERYDLDPALIAVIEKMMAWEPADRYQTAQEAQAELAAFLKNRKGGRPKSGVPSNVATPPGGVNAPPPRKDAPPPPPPGGGRPRSNIAAPPGGASRPRSGIAKADRPGSNIRPGGARPASNARPTSGVRRRSDVRPARPSGVRSAGDRPVSSIIEPQPKSNVGMILTIAVIAVVAVGAMAMMMLGGNGDPPRNDGTTDTDSVASNDTRINQPPIDLDGNRDRNRNQPNGGDGNSTGTGTADAATAAWEAIPREGELQERMKALRAFLAKYGDDERYAGQAKTQLRVLEIEFDSESDARRDEEIRRQNREGAQTEWDAIPVAGVIEVRLRALNAFVGKFRDEKYVDDFIVRATGLIGQLEQQKLAADAAFDELSTVIDELPRVRALAAFLDQHPDSGHAEEVKVELERLRSDRRLAAGRAWRELPKEGSDLLQRLLAVRAFLATHPDTDHLQDGQQLRDQLEQQYAAALKAAPASLLWLRDHQSADGFWDPVHFADAPLAKQNRSGSYANADGSDSKGWPEARGGVTGLALLAFLRAGHTPTQGIFGDVVASGINWLVANQTEDGVLDPEFVDNPMVIYGHAMCTLAVIDAYVATTDETLKTAAERGLAFIAKAQNRDGNQWSGWRYGVAPGESDSSVTGWMALACAAAVKAGLKVEDHCLEGAQHLLDSMSGLRDGQPKTGYRRKAGLNDRLDERKDWATNDTMDALMLLVRMKSVGERNARGLRNEPVFRTLADRMCDAGRPVTNDVKQRDYYYWHFATRAMFEMGFRHWRTWEPLITSALADTQRRDGDAASACYGSWDTDSAWGPAGGRVYTTAINALTLATPGAADRLEEQP